MARTIGILLFDGAEEMDFAGPWEVFTAAVSGMPSDRVITIGERSRPVTCEMGMRVIPDLPYGDAPEVDVVLVPGGSGARREIANPATTNWLRNAAAKCTWLTSVCTGALLLVGAGLARGRRVTTHHDFIHDLREKCDLGFPSRMRSEYSDEQSAEQLQVADHPGDESSPSRQLGQPGYDFRQPQHAC